MHYPEELLEHSARIAYEIMARDHVGGYCAMHVRRGDFQYKQTRIPPSEILQNVRPLINRCSKLYISTDERDKSLFKEFERNFQVFYREDFEAEFFNPIEKRLHGMLEQLICVSARTFIATELSTFSAFIHRMRAFVSAELSPNKEVYITTRKYTGDPVKDNELTKATWLLDSKPKWPHSPWSRDFHFIWFTD